MILVVRWEIYVLSKVERGQTVRNWEVRWSVGLSMCILKSPVMRNSCGMVAAVEKKEVNSKK